MIHKILEDGVDIDRILVVTFTNAAASEMRERILDAIYAKMEEEPENRNLQKQITLLNKASICTIHSFCLEVIRNHFYEIDTSANFRIADTAEVDLLCYETLEEVFEEQYEKQNPAFLNLLEMYTGYRDDMALQELVLKIHKFIQSMPFPEEWLEEQIAQLCFASNQDFSETGWGKILLEYGKDVLDSSIRNLDNLIRKMAKDSELEKFQACVEQDRLLYEEGKQAMNSWKTANLWASQIEWKKWPVDKKVTSILKEDAKDLRDQIKKQVKTMCEKNFFVTNEQIAEDLSAMYEPMCALKDLVFQFEVRFAEKKKEKNMVDFSDIEHFALRILVEKKDGEIVPTAVAKQYQEKFAEVAIDEYQDSNLVQEYILQSVAKNNNRFMVGDVKQSIYKFRQARPELFLEKYRYYGENGNDQGKRIQLFKNFRSRENILQVTNSVFEAIMSEKLGEMEYTKEEYLNLGADYKEKGEVAEEHFVSGKVPEDFTLETKTEIALLEKPSEVWNQWEEDEPIEENGEPLDDIVIEAQYVARRIEELVQSNQYVWDKKKKAFRKVTYRDIAVLLRSTSGRAPIFEKEMQERDIPVFTDTGTQFLDSIEIQTVLSLLKIIDNPMQDIPLVTVLRSSMAGFTDNELVQIRCADKTCNFYEAMQKAQIQVEQNLRKKIADFLARLQAWKKEEKELALDELLWKLYEETGYYHFVGLMQNGEMRQANLKILFEKAKQYEKTSLKGLFQFIRFVEKLKQNSGDFGSAKTISENENVVRIMSIHKSKGLEFPIVFVCSMNKSFNMRDTTEPILLHHSYGLGVTYKNPKTKVEYPTLSKEAIKKVMEQETISEEMRILYVALTRAKERLILTGVVKDADKRQQDKEKELEINQDEKFTGKVPPSLCRKYHSYLDWMELVYLANSKAKQQMEIHIVPEKEWKQEQKPKEDKESEMQMQEKLEKILEQKKQEKDFRPKQEALKRDLTWEYPYQILASIPTKTSVTQLKEWALEEQEEAIANIAPEPLGEETVELAKPAFLQEKQGLTPAEIGTIMHKCIQKLDESKEYNKASLEGFVDTLCEKGILTEDQKKGVSIPLLEAYVQSDLFQEIRLAKKVEKEKPFYLQIPASEIWKEEKLEKTNETILVQGVIDLYYLDKNDKLVLVDYKTDFVKDGEEKKIQERYAKQLEIYQRALEKAYGRKVDSVQICLIRKNSKCISLK